MDETQKIMAQIWLKALREGEVKLTFPAKSDSTRAKFLLYGLSKLVKQGKFGLNLELSQAVADCMISQLSETELVVRHKALSPFLLGITAQLGTTPEGEKFKTDEERELEESAARMMKAQEEADARAKAKEEMPKFHNPYTALLHKNDPNRNGGQGEE